MIQIRTNSKTFLPWLQYLVFFAGIFIYFGFFADYIFFYQEKSSLFVFSYNFLLENLHQPGGPLIWLGKFLSTFYFYPLAGALIVSVILTLIVRILFKIIFLLTGKHATVIPFIAGTALFYLQTDYRFLLFNSLGLLLQLAFFCLVIRYITFFKGWIPVLITPLLFYVTGSFAGIFIMLISCYFTFDKTTKGWIRIIALWCLSLLIFYISKEFLFFQSGKTLLTFPFSENNTGSQPILFFSVTGLLSMIPAISEIKFSRFKNPGIPEFYFSIITTAILVSALVIIGFLRFDNKAKQYFYVENLFYQDKFDEVIAYNNQNPPANLLTIFLNNIALCEADKLDDQLFHFPQSPDGKTLFMKWEMADEVLKRGGYFYYSIGMINEAHRWAFENMVMKGLSPEGVKMLIKTELINGNYEVASRYINILEKTFFYNKEAKAFESLLNNEAAINSDKELGKKRRTRIINDFFSITDNPYINLEMILANDSLNRNAFEYKMAFMLMKKNFNGIAHELPRFEKFGYTRLPVHVEEAAIALSVSNKGRLPDMGNLQISKNTEVKWNQYLTVLQQYGNDLKSAESVLRSRFGDTFWYYVFYK